MKPCDLVTGASRIRRALDDLLLTWDTAQADWNDPVSAAFYKERIEPLEPVVKSALDAIGRLQLVATSAQRDLEE